MIESSPFSHDSHSVSIMDGKDEGLFSWFTINFLLDHLNKDIKQSAATIDLGGGSVQITFVPESTDQIRKETPDHLHRVSIHNQAVDTYSYRYDYSLISIIYFFLCVSVFRNIMNCQMLR